MTNPSFSRSSLALNVQVHVLWRMRGPKRVIAAWLVHRPEGHELVVFFEGLEKGVIESQFDPLGTHDLVNRADTLREVLRRKGLTPVEAPATQPELVGL